MAGMKGLLLIAGLIITLIPHALFAHVQTSDGSVSGVLHIDPGDEAYTGKTFGLQIQVENSKGPFSMKSCGCHLDIFDESGKVFSSSTTTEKIISGDTMRVDYEFPHNGTYTLMFQGKSPVFSLHYTVPVPEKKDVSVLAPYYHLIFHHLSHVIIFGLGFIFAAYILLRHEH
jgi:hypothetical protein